MEQKLTHPLEILQKHIGACRCGPLYENRRLIDPDCVYCNYSKDFIEALQELTAAKDAEIAALKKQVEEQQGDPVRFGRWLLKNCGSGFDNGGLCWFYEHKYWNTKELYEHYKQQQP